MKVVGSKKLMRQMKDLPAETHASLKKSIERTVKYGSAKAKSIVPVDTGDLKSKISHKVYEKNSNIYGFVNFHDDTKDAAIKVGVVNYGRKGSRTSSGSRIKGSVAKTGTSGGYGFIEFVKERIGDRHVRTVQRALNKAIKEAMK
jgi:hypothetical protein